MDQLLEYLQKTQKSRFLFSEKKVSLSVVYVDHSYPQGDSYEECLSNVPNTIEILRYFGFTIHPNSIKMYHIFKIYFGLCPIENNFNARKKRKKFAEDM